MHSGPPGQRDDANSDGPEWNLAVERSSRAYGGWSLTLGDGRNRCACLSGSTGFADAGPGFQERNLSTGQAAVVDKFIANTATRPAAAEQRLVPIQTLLADFTMAGFDPQQHRLPITAGFSDTHGQGV